jgi:hypothetical protein
MRVAQCQARKHDTKAELNRRSQVCDALAGTGVRVAKASPSAPNLASGHYLDRAGSLPAGQIHLGNGRASGYRALYSGLEDRRVSLNTYAREVGTIIVVGCFKGT